MGVLLFHLLARGCVSTLLFKAWVMFAVRVCMHPAEPGVDCPNDLPFLPSNLSLNIPSARKPFSISLTWGMDQGWHIAQLQNICIFFFRFFSLTVYYKILGIVPCAIQQVLVVHLFYIQSCVYIIPQFLIYPFPPGPFPFGNHKFVFYVCESLSVLQISPLVSVFQIPRISDII